MTTLTPRWRKALLTLHLITAMGWLGIDLVLVTLGISGAAGWRPDVVYPAMGYLGLVLFVPLTVLVWLVGVVNAWTTPWGIFRHWWVIAKLAIASVMLVLVLFVLRPTLELALADGAALAEPKRVALVAAPCMSTALLMISTVLATYKPWGRRRVAA